jgi:serine/threonine protein kinase
MSLIEKSAAAALFRSVGRDGSASAVKVLTAPDGDPSLHRRTVVLRREARYLAASRSPYIPRLVAVDDRGLWLAREFIAGRTLETACQSSSTVDRLEVLRQVSIMTQDLFTRFHEYKGGAHVLRDFKPRNIVLDENCPRAVCVDLGGVAAEGTAARAEDGKIRLGTGKWRFWAPEQLTNAEHVGRQADYFAYASIVFFILKGRPVLRNALADRASARCGFLDDYEEAMRDLQSSRHVGLNESFVEFLAACLQPDPHARPTAFPALDFDQCPR